jgi:ribosome-associated translation inhibitor RaiA
LLVRGGSGRGQSRYVGEVERPIQITFRGMDPSPAVEAEIRERAHALQHYFGRIIGFQVVIDQPAHHSRNGNAFEVHIEASVPGGPPVVVSRHHHDRPEHTDIYVAIRDAFNAARRQLLDRARRQRGDVKIHARAV